MRVQSTYKSGNERILKGRIQRVLQKGLIDLKKGDTIRLHSNTTCDCPHVTKLNADYLVAGHEDLRQKKFYLYPGTGVVETWGRVWVSKFRRWERRLAAKLLGKKHIRKNKKRRRKGNYNLSYNDDAISVFIDYKHSANSSWHPLGTSYLQTLVCTHVGVTSNKMFTSSYVVACFHGRNIVFEKLLDYKQPRSQGLSLQVAGRGETMGTRLDYKNCMIKPRFVSQTLALIILAIMRKPNPIIVLKYHHCSSVL